VSNYSRQELEVARSNLKLLKNRMSSQKKPSMGGVGASYDEPNFNRGGYGATPSGGYENDKRPFNYEENGSYNLNRQTGYGGMSGRPPSGRRGPGGQTQPADNYNNQNFRRAFVPNFGNDPSSQTIEHVNDVVLGGNVTKSYQQYS
jgi:hypothetical protein